MRLPLIFALVLPLLAQETILLRPNAPVDPAAPAEKVEERGTADLHDRSISNVSQPSITVYLPSKENATGKAIVICPGGAYTHLAIDKEGHEIARWLNTIGVAGIVLKYRLPGQKNMRASMGEIVEAAEAARVAIEDAELAMTITRAHASKWNIKQDKIGMMGFSAGGNLAAMVGMLAPKEQRPDFLVLGYPAMPRTFKVTASTPPSFIVHADDDRLASSANSVPFYLELKKAKVPAEMHIYANGGHGFGIRKTDKTSAAWPQAFEAWLATIK
jgi:acetyl esterase/lipase